MITQSGKKRVQKYKAILNQIGTAAPIVNVLENTYGSEIVWTRSTAGNYIGTGAPGMFPVNKTITPPFDTLGMVTLPLWGPTTTTDWAYQAYPDADEQRIWVSVMANDGSNVELSTTGAHILVTIETYNYAEGFEA